MALRNLSFWILLSSLSLTAAYLCDDRPDENSSPGCYQFDNYTICYKVNNLFTIQKEAKTTELVLIECHIEYMDFKTFPVHLQRVQIEDCSGEYLVREAFSSLNNLEYIFVNELECSNDYDMEEFLNGIASLKKLDLKNHLRQLHWDTFIGLDNLTTLYVNDNDIEFIYNSSVVLPSLELLDVQNNVVCCLEVNSFAGLTALRELLLANNKLAIIKGFSADLGNLEYLYLENNILSDIKPKTFEPLVSLKLLNLANNRLTSLGNTGFNTMPALKSVNLLNNPDITLQVELFENLESLAIVEVNSRFCYLRQDFRSNKISAGVVFQLDEKNKCN